ncbi:MAG: thymidine phosphorylase [Patescibacteria group bacterium]
MRAVDIIEKKRDGGILTRQEIDFFIKGMVKKTVPDYQVAAWCMAVYFRGLDEEETIALAQALLETGITLDLSSISLPTADKHSTGGVGDKTTLVLVPLVAAAGVAVAKMSGRGLGHTGGTLDKLESIPGMRTGLSPEEMISQVGRIGIAIAGQSETLVPGDAILYTLRDVTGTVQNISLIAASIMAKKLAGGAESLLLDVKFGSGALLPDPADGRRLADLMAKIGQAAGRRVRTCLTSMEAPLGVAIGNALEVKEAIETLKGEGPGDLRRLCLHLAAEILVLTGVADDYAQGERRAETLLQSGAAKKKFGQLVEAQGGDPGVLDRPDLLPAAKATVRLCAPRSGYLARVDVAGLGRVAMRLGAGRAKKDDRIDPGAGLLFWPKPGDRLEKDQPLAELHTNRLAEIEPAQLDLLDCLSWSDAPVQAPSLFLDRP